MCRQEETQQRRQQTMHQPLQQTEQLQERTLQIPIEQDPMQEYQPGSRLAENIRRQAEPAPDGIQPPMAEMAQQRAEERAALTKSEKKTQKRQQREQERLRRQQAEQTQQEHLQRERAQAEQRRREQLPERAREMTLQNSVVQGVTQQDWEQHGGASYHYVMPEAQAQQIVTDSHGCIYAKPVADGLAELRATLPETMQINGREIPFRKSYNLLMKTIAHRMMDRKGRLKTGAAEFANQLENAMGGPLYDENLVEDKLRMLLWPTFRKLFRSETQAQQAYQDMYATIRALSYTNNRMDEKGCGLPSEILGALTSFANDVEKMDSSSFALKKEAERKKLQRDVDAGKLTPQRMQEKLDAMQSSELKARKKRIKAQMRREGRSEEEQQAMLKNVTSMYADLDAAKLEFFRMRDLDVNGQEVFLPNACSANAEFYETVSYLIHHEKKNKTVYRTDDHMASHPQVHIQYALSHFKGTEQERAELQAMQEKVQRGEALNPSEVDKLRWKVNDAWKYTFHAAGNIFQGENLQVTIEEFAAETTEYAVSPFSTKSAIGVYRGAITQNIRGEYISDGMVRYYNHDNPLPDAEKEELVKTKFAMLKGRLPGDEDYQPEAGNA